MRDKTHFKIELTLIRHGSTKSNEEKRYLGQTDEALSDKGIREITDKKSFYNKSDLLFISPMLRCRQTAEILFPAQEAYVIEEWKEIDFGQFEGKSYQELSGNPLYQEWVDSGCKGQIPDGETLEVFINRSMLGLKKSLEICEKHLLNLREMTKQVPLNYSLKMADNSTKELISATAIVHGGTIMSILSSLTNSDYFDFQVKNGEGYILEFNSDKLIDFKPLYFV
ncbi:MAG: histidine phosphatase family protein [Lachnospiraceae bacterium]|nr:histidine phosphatase family protein [Lachnospiraceae bacterium]